MWDEDRIQRCERCEHSKKSHTIEYHEICEADICMYCYQLRRCDCDAFVERVDDSL